MYKAKKKLSNRTRILECVYRNAPIARTQIAEMTEITPATVTATVAGLISEGVIVEVGEAAGEDSVSGRKRVLIDIDPGCRYSMGLEFTEKALVVCLTDIKGRLVRRKELPFCEELAEHITSEIIRMVKSLVEEEGISWERLAGVGVAVPGHMDPEQRELITNRGTWKKFHAEQVRESLPVPVVFENNARCMALGRYLYDPYSSPDSFAFFHVGLGMFCANVVEGELFLGNTYVAGEIGHTIVKEGGRRCECGKYGCLQTYSSEKRILKNASLLYANSPDTILRSLVGRGEDLSIEDVTTAYSMGDPVICSYISEALRYLGIMISNIAIIMNPGKIFLHGRMFDNEDVRRELMDYIERQLLFVEGDPRKLVEILPYSLDDGAIGASALAVMRLFM